MTTLNTLDSRIKVLENKEDDLVGRYYQFSQKLEQDHILIYARYFDKIVDYFRLEKGATYSCDVLFENKGGSGQILSDVTIIMNHSIDNNPKNFNTTPIISTTRNNALIISNESVLVNFNTITIPTQSNYMELFLSVNIKAFNPGQTCVSLHLFKVTQPTRTFVGSFTQI